MCEAILVGPAPPTPPQTRPPPTPGPRFLGLPAVIEWEEWGCPRDKEYYDYMKSYSPVDNLRAADYPNILVTAGLHDPRVCE
jgi:hypothetical protein